MTERPGELIQKRFRVGVTAVACLTTALVLAMTGHLQSPWTSSLLRVGIVLGALWLALPTQTRPAAWAHLSRWWLVGIVLTAVLLPRLKPFWPVLLIGILIGWLIRPRRRSTLPQNALRQRDEHDGRS